MWYIYSTTLDSIHIQALVKEIEGAVFVTLQSNSDNFLAVIESSYNVSECLCNEGIVEDQHIADATLRAVKRTFSTYNTLNIIHFLSLFILACIHQATSQRVELLPTSTVDLEINITPECERLILLHINLAQSDIILNSTYLLSCVSGVESVPD